MKAAYQDGFYLKYLLLLSAFISSSHGPAYKLIRLSLLVFPIKKKHLYF